MTAPETSSGPGDRPASFTVLTGPRPLDRVRRWLTAYPRLSERDANLMGRSVVLEETAPPGSVHATIAIGAAVVLGFFIWSAQATFDEKAMAPGEVLPINFVQPVQHLEGGIVSRVLIADGDRVAQGQPLVALDETAPRAELDGLKARAASLGLQIERQRAFSLDRAPDFSAYQAGYPELASDQRQLYAAQIASRDAQLGVIDAQIAARGQELEGLKERQGTRVRQVELLSEELALREELLGKGLTSKVVYLATKREVNRSQGELAEIKTEMARARSTIAEVRGRRLEQEERLRNAALDEIGRLSGELAEVKERLNRLVDRVARTVVHAPTAGVVNGLTVTGPGGVVAPGQTLLEIVPVDDTMLAEVRISPKDVGHITAGMPAMVRVDTFSFARVGGIPGQVERVSASSFQSEQGEAYFTALISLDQGFVGPDPLSNRITPGMTLTADIKTGQKSLLGYLIRPVYNSLNSAFSER